jgi:type III restriction enzyme
LAAVHHINLKPVVLFKAKRTIAEPELNKERSQLVLNTLENEDNPVRAVFAVQKLNEGWDVLNLFDIVRLYEDRDGKDGKPGKTTLAEAQLIGRGARYFPFKISTDQDKYTRKYDTDTANELKVLEELFYHTKEDSRYVSEIKKALIDSGIYEDDTDLIEKHLTLKATFKESEFYRTKRVFFNQKIAKNYSRVKSFADLGVKKVNVVHELSSGVGRMTTITDEFELEAEIDKIGNKDLNLSDIPTHIIRSALTQNPFFYFDSLQRFFPNVASMAAFIKSKNYLGDLAITIRGTTKRRNELSNQDYLRAVHTLLREIELQIKTNQTEYEGSEVFVSEYINKIFTDKKLRINRKDERANGQEELVKSADWYVYNANYGTSEEKRFVEMFARRVTYLYPKFNDIYLIRNERNLKIYDKQGCAFEPDFILFATQKQSKGIIYQIFIEPKGKHLIGNDQWKQDFLIELRNKQMTIRINTDRYLITGVPFYNYANENEFAKKLEDVLEA